MKFDEGFKFNTDWAESDPTKVEALEFRQFIGKSRLEIVRYLTDEFPDKNKYEFLGPEYHKFLLTNTDKVPEVMKDGKRYYFFGSNMSGEEVKYVHFLTWTGRDLSNGSGVVAGDWGPLDRVLVIQK